MISPERKLPSVRTGSLPWAADPAEGTNESGSAQGCGRFLIAYRHDAELRAIWQPAVEDLARAVLDVEGLAGGGRRCSTRAQQRSCRLLCGLLFLSLSLELFFGLDLL